MSSSLISIITMLGIWIVCFAWARHQKNGNNRAASSVNSNYMLDSDEEILAVGTGKISDLKEMLMTFFWGNDSVLKEKLEREVEADTIVIATTEHFLNLVHSADGTYFYCITPKGKKYMNSK